MVVSNNVFAGNYGNTIHCDGAVGFLASPILIANNFLDDTNFNPLGSCLWDVGGGIELEVSSEINVVSNVIISASSGIAISGSSSNNILNNIVLITSSLMPYRANYGSLVALQVAPSYSRGIFTNAAACNNVISNVFVSYYTSPMICVGQSSNAFNATPYGPLEFSNVYAYNLTWNYPESRNASGPPIELGLFSAPDYTGYPSTFTNAQAYFQAATGTDGTNHNIGNLVAAPVAAPVMLGLSQSPSANPTTAPSLKIAR